MITRMTTLQVYRLEMKDGPHYKQYTAFGNDDYCFFGFSRIDNAWQWSVKNEVGDRLGRMLSQLHAKEGRGYERVWHGDLTIPGAWAEDPRFHADKIQTFAEDLFRKELPSGTAGTPVSDQRPSPLSDLLDNARSVVSKMAVDPDSALAEYASLLAGVEAAQSDLDTVTSYMETLQIMLNSGV